jgi:putative PIN family toxin of toxin-antitoxin system
VKIVLDTNVVVSGIFWGGVPHTILEHCMSNEVEFIASSPIVNEYVRVISSVGHKRPEFAKKWIDLISTSVTIVDVQVSLSVSRDPEDDKFVECAISGDADCIVSGDDDLLAVQDVHGIPILRPSEFLRRFF